MFEVSRDDRLKQTGINKPRVLLLRVLLFLFASISGVEAKTRVFVQNNTGKEFSVRVTQS
jgi:hypothetical protein